MGQDQYFAECSINIQGSIYRHCRVYHLNIKQELRERQVGGGEQKAGSTVQHDMKES